MRCNIDCLVKTGSAITPVSGRVFHDDDSEAQIRSDLDGIGQDLRNQYLLIYRPGELKRDASFHIIQLKAPERVDAIQIRSGYYAPAH